MSRKRKTEGPIKTHLRSFIVADEEGCPCPLSLSLSSSLFLWLDANGAKMEGKGGRKRRRRKGRRGRGIGRERAREGGGRKGELGREASCMISQGRKTSRPGIEGGKRKHGSQHLFSRNRIARTVIRMRLCVRWVIGCEFERNDPGAPCGLSRCQNPRKMFPILHAFAEKYLMQHLGICRGKNEINYVFDVSRDEV